MLLAGIVLCFLYLPLILKPFQYEPWIALPFHVTYAFLGQLFFLISALLILKKRGVWPVVFFPRPVEMARESLISFGLVIVMSISVGILVHFLGRALGLQREAPNLMRIMQNGPSNGLVIAVMLMGFLLAPVAEELFFRGFLHNALKKWLPITAAVGIQTTLFAVTHHYDLLNTVAILLIGLTFTLIYEQRKNLLRPMLMHAFLNGIAIVPFLLLSLQNYHVPAATWEAAGKDPEWIMPDDPEIPMQENGFEQWQYAINTWGSNGSRHWKKEASAFRSVCIYFPKDRTSCAKAKLGIVTIYSNHLFDYRRAITEAQDLMSGYPEQRPQIATALAKMGWSYYMLRDSERSHAAFRDIMTQHKDQLDAVKSAKKGLDWLEKLKK